MHTFSLFHNFLVLTLKTTMLTFKLPEQFRNTSTHFHYFLSFMESFTCLFFEVMSGDAILCEDICFIYELLVLFN